jgi:SAM-dependent methyltransferase
MPVNPGFLEQQALRFNLIPGPMLDFLGARSFRVTCVAVRMGVFETLEEEAQTPAELARRLGADERGVFLLLEVLDAVGCVQRRGERFVNSRMISKWMPLLREGIDFFERSAFHAWNDLEESIRRGRVPETSYQSSEDAHTARELLVGLRAFARVGGEGVVSKIDPPTGATRLLDLGGGHGLYTVMMCQRNPRLHGVIFDLPFALEIARETVEEAGLADRVSLIAGDFWEDDFGTDYDCALLFNVVHGYAPEQNAELLGKLRACLRSGARIAILDQLADSKLGGAMARAAARLNGLNLFHSRGGQGYRFDEIASWLRAAGFTDPRKIDLPRSPGSSLVLAGTGLDVAPEDVGHR